MDIVLLEPFFTGSHQRWAEEYAHFSQHHVEIVSLPGRHWKWRMYGAAVTFARILTTQWKKVQSTPDLIIATDMLDLAAFRGLLAQAGYHIPCVLYFHENQLTYPWSATDADVDLKRDRHYAFTNFTSALAADAVCFNSTYHQNSFLNALPDFLRAFPDFTEVDQVEHIRSKSRVLSLGMNLQQLDHYRITAQNETPIILWNHRWEYDKCPEAFLKVMSQLKKRNISFELVLLGQPFRKMEQQLKSLLDELQPHIRHMGYVEDFESYAHWLWRSDILFVTSNQDFFGGSVVEALYAECIPLLPKRLAYPEHIPEELREQYLYEGEGVEALAQLLRSPNSLHVKRIRERVGAYDWRMQVKQYDSFFSEVKLSLNR